MRNLLRLLIEVAPGLTIYGLAVLAIVLGLKH